MANTTWLTHPSKSVVCVSPLDKRGVSFRWYVKDGQLWRLDGTEASQLVSVDQVVGRLVRQGWTKRSGKPRYI